MAEKNDSKADKGAETTKEAPTGLDPTDMGSKLAAAESARAAAQGEADKVKAYARDLEEENRSLREHVKELQQQNEKLEKLAPVAAPKGAARLLESVVVFRWDTEPRGARAYAKRGDILLVEATSANVTEAQRKVGQAATVFSVARAAVEELHKAGQVEPC